jgi:glycosyltransferase involved in cell wall biosynthesis
MKIAFVTLEYPPSIFGGAGVYAENICSHLGLLGHDVVVFVPYLDNNNRFEEHSGVRIVPVKVQPGLPPSLQFWIKLRRKIREEGDFDLVHINSAAYPFLFKKHLASCPQILTIHHLVKDARTANHPSLYHRFKEVGGENGFILPLIERNCIRASDMVITVSAFSANRLTQEYDLRREKVAIIPSFLDKTFYASDLDLNMVRNKYDLLSKNVLLFVGRLDDPRKGLDILIDALALLKDKHTILVIVGNGNKVNIVEQAKSLGVGDQLRYTGFVSQSELAALYQISIVCIVPSRMEGFGLNAIQAMAMGKPLVASRAGALPEVIGIEEELVPVDNPGALAKTLGLLLSCKDLQNRLGKMNQERFKSFPTWKEIAILTVDVYKQILVSLETKSG